MRESPFAHPRQDYPTVQHKTALALVKRFQKKSRIDGMLALVVDWN